MAASGFTPISLYHSTSAAAVPTNTNLVNGELAINITDGKLYYKDNAGVVRLLASNATSTPVTSISFGSTGLTPSTTTTGAVTVAGTLAVTNGGTGATTLTGVLKGNGTSAFSAATINTDYLVPALANTAVTGFKTATFNSQTTIATTSGSITIDWTTAQNQRQTEPTGTITYTFTAPPGPCHLQLLIDSDGTSTAQTINFPGSVTFLGSTFAGANNKKAIINFWYDGTNYFAVGTNQV